MFEQLKELDNEVFLVLNGSNSVYWDTVMWIVTKTTTWIPLLLILLYIIMKNSNQRRLVMVVIALTITIILADRISSGLIKPIAMRWRPTHDATFLHTIDTVMGYMGGRYGFVSSHAANTFSIFIFISMLFKSRLMTICLLLWACVSSYSRIYLGVHFPGDILCGALLGFFVGLITFQLYKYISKRMESEVMKYYSMAYTSSGFLYSDIHLLAFSLMLTYAVILLAAIPLSLILK